ncbi:MAG: WYL domain-containing protein [Spirochaetia bacterium]|jgi:predicted DNA-binding transcriptional regulator YafY|nr:WYL domain-containing protein [Spirochaetia bacterium]
MNAKNHLERILFIDTYIRSGSFPSKKKFSNYFEVSAKTIERDFEYLRDRLDAPLEYNKDRKGYYYTDDTYFLPSLNFSSEEVFSLGLSLETVKSLGNPDISASLSKGLDKLFKFLPDKIKNDMVIINARSLFVGPPPVKMNTKVWKPLLEAIISNRKININYKTPGHNKSVKRLLNPYYLLNNQNMWYILAYNEIRDSIETYAVHRVENVEILTDTFVISDTFEVDEHIDRWWGIFSKEKMYKVKLEFENGAALRVNERVWLKSYKIIKKSDGRLILEFKTNQLESLMFWLLSWGEDAKVVDPPILKEMILNNINGMRKRYE